MAMTHISICQYAQKMYNLVLPDQYQAGEGRFTLMRAYLEWEPCIWHLHKLRQWEQILEGCSLTSMLHHRAKRRKKYLTTGTWLLDWGVQVFLTLWHPFVGPCPHRDRDYCIGSNFWKFHLIRTNFTLGELVSLVKVFRLFRLERTFLVFRVWTQ
jgi:hypothetical protein